MPPALSRSASRIQASVFADLAPRIGARARAGGDLVELHIGDTHRSPPIDARFARIEDATFDAALYRYGAVGGLEALREAFAARLVSQGVVHSAVDPARQVLVGGGATHAIFCGLRAVLDAGDEVLVVAPYWPLAVGIVRAAGGVPVEVPLTPRLYADPGLDPGPILEASITPRTRALYLITPNNPDGKVLSRPQLASIARVAIARDLWVLSDEVYLDYVYEGDHVSPALLDGMAERTLGAYSLSKSHALAGARIGFLVAPERVVAVARRVATHTVFHPPVAAQRVACAALRAPTTWIDDARREYRAARDQAVSSLSACGARVLVPEGGSYVFADFAEILDGRPLKDLLERAIDRGVLVAPGSGFGEAFASWARLCFTSVPTPRLAEGLARLQDAIDGMRRG
ncbi:MAG TPA: pyridoxal phosphate-dependent aminotransferase [Polyangiaceae bacterium]|nr:pyridoxal phosphate-dependent aminotransferase [Polyangiaceae bacterium]